MKLPHGYFEYSKADVMDILNIYEVIGILNTKWRYGIIQKLTPWVFWIFIVALVFLIFIQNYVPFWIFIVMTSLQEYSKYQCHYECSKYPWRQLWIFPWRQFVSIQNTHDMNIQNTHDVSLIFKIPMTSALNYRMNTQITHEVTSWITMTSLREYSKYQLHHFMNFQNNHGDSFRIFKWGILNIHEVTSLVFWIFTKWRHGNI